MTLTAMIAEESWPQALGRVSLPFIFRVIVLFVMLSRSFAAKDL